MVSYSDAVAAKRALESWFAVRNLDGPDTIGVSRGDKGGFFVSAATSSPAVKDFPQNIEGVRVVYRLVERPRFIAGI